MKNATYLPLIFTFLLFGCSSDYEQAKEAIQSHNYQEARQEFKSVLINNKSSDSLKAEATSALLLLSAIDALGQKQYPDCIAKLHGIKSNSEWKHSSDSLALECDRIFREDVNKNAEAKNYDSLALILYKMDPTRISQNKAFKELTYLTDHIKRNYYALPSISGITYKIENNNIKINSYSMAIKQGETDIFAQREVYGDNIAANSIEQYVAECKNKMAQLETETAELELKQRPTAIRKSQLENLYLAITGNRLTSTEK